MQTPALDILRTKTAFWGGATQGIFGLPYSEGQREAVEASPRELSDAEYNHVTGGFQNAAAVVPRGLGHGLVGGALGSIAGGVLGGLAGGTLDLGGGHGNASTLFPLGAIAGGSLGAVGGMAHGINTAARDHTAENIEAVDTDQTVLNRHPLATFGGSALLAGGSAASLGLNIPVAAGMGLLGHGVEALRGRAHSYLHDPANELSTSGGVLQTNPDMPGSMWQTRVRSN